MTEQQADTRAVRLEVEAMVNAAVQPAVFLTERQLRDRLFDEIRVAGSQKAWAERHGLSPGYVSDVVTGRREMSEAIAAALGFFKKSVFLPARKSIVKELSHETRA